MRLKFTQTVRHTLLYGISIALMKGISLIMLPFIAHHLAPEQFGTLEVLLSLAVIGSVLVGLGLEDALYRFVGQAKAQEQRRIAGQVYAMAILVSLLTLLLSFLVAPTIVALLPVEVSLYELQLVLYLLALESLIAVPLGWLRMQDKARLFFIATVGRVILQAILTVLFLWHEATVADVLEAGLIAALVQALLLVSLQLKEINLRWQWRFAGQILVYSWPILISGMVAFVLMGLDRLVIAEFTNLSEVALYGVASKFALAVVLLLQPYTMWWAPRRFQVLHSENGHQKAVNFIMLGWVVLVLSTFVVISIAPFLVHWLMPTEYFGAVQILLILALAMAFKEAAELLNIGCFVNAKTYAQMWINIAAAALGLLALWLWTPLYGAMGAAYAILLAQAFKTLLFFALSQYFYRLDYPLLKAALFSLLVLTLAVLSHQFVLSYFIMALAFLLLPAFMLLAIKIQLFDRRILFAQG